MLLALTSQVLNDLKELLKNSFSPLLARFKLIKASNMLLEKVWRTFPASLKSVSLGRV